MTSNFLFTIMITTGRSNRFPSPIVILNRDLQSIFSSFEL